MTRVVGSDTGNGTFNFFLLDVSSKAREEKSISSKSDDVGFSKETVGERRALSEHKALHKPAAFASAPEEVEKLIAHTGVTPLSTLATSVGGGVFTRHLRRSGHQDVRSSIDYATESDQQNAYRLSVFSSLISPSDGVECELLNETVACRHGYELSMEKQSEWRYMHARQWMPSKLKINASYLQK